MYSYVSGTAPGISFVLARVGHHPDSAPIPEPWTQQAEDLLLKI